MKTNLVVLFLAIELGIVGIALYRFNYPVKIATSPMPIKTISANSFDPYKPPSSTLNGTITAQHGEISWQSREATEPSVVKEINAINQGERLKTGKNGTVTVSFNTFASFTLSGQSDINIVQTLAQNLVLNQTEGTVLYSAAGQIPVSIRSFHLLADITKGKISFTTDSDKNKIYVKVTEGEVNLGYNDKNLNSQTLVVTEGKEAIFDDDTRTVIITKLK